jgi:signal transduction histidine kinase/CheY-like chemotaxis protein
MLRGTALWKAACVGILVAGSCLGAMAWVKERETSRRRDEIRRETRVIARLFATRIQGGLQSYVTALEQMANFYTSSRKVSEKEFRSFAAATLRKNPACVTVAFVDPAFLVRDVYPANANRWLIGLDMRAHPLGYETIDRARRVRGPVLSPPLQLIRGPSGFELAVPAFARGRLQGTFLAICQSEEYFTSLLLPEMTARFEERVLDSGLGVFVSPGFDPSDGSLPIESEAFDLGNVTWEIQAQPQTLALRGLLSSGRTPFWIMGGLLAFVCGAVASGGALWAAGMSARLESNRAALDEARIDLDGTREKLAQAEKMTALGELVAGVAHEINNPLTGIVGYSQLLMKKDLPQGIRRHLGIVAEEAGRLTKIVRNLLTFARKRTPEKRLDDLNLVIEKTLELKAYQLRVNQIKVATDLAPRLPMTQIDFQQIQQVLINLLSNAQQALAETGHGGTIRLATRALDGRIEMRVSDDGPGVPAELRERIFEPFFTTRKGRGGTGLGLSMCYGIVQGHGGTIHVESQPGEGTTFVVSLPVVQSSGAEPEHGPTALPAPVRPLRILVVDDEPSVLTYLSELLSERSHIVDTAPDVPEALEKIAAGRYDLFITDMKMPQGSGRDVYRAVVEKNPRLARRVIFISGQPAGDTTQRFFKEVGGAFLAKPFTIEEVVQAVAAAIRSGTTAS